MMLNIKFRVWDRTVKVMAKVNQINFHSDYTYPQVIYRYKDPRTGKVTDERANFGWDDGCDIVRVMQYTGLKDSNGKEIYEGDILEITITSRSDGSQRKPYNLVVVYKNGAFVYQYIQGGWKESNLYSHIDNFAGNVTFEVIGNRYENPELLKEHEDVKTCRERRKQ